MRADLPIPGSTRASLLDAGWRQFSTQSYDRVEVTAIAAQAGVTIGALYHHFQSKVGLYGVLRNDMTRRVLDRMEAAAEAAPPPQQLQAATLAAYDGVLRTGAGLLLIDPDPRGLPDEVAEALSVQASALNIPEAEVTGHLIAAALRAALRAGTTVQADRGRARAALQHLLAGLAN